MNPRVLVCGGRDFRDDDLVCATLDSLRPAEVAHGGAAGADRTAGAWAICALVPCRVFRAEWEKHGRAAGPIRNQRMLDEFKPDLVVAFKGGAGTADMVRRAEKAGVPVMRVERAAAVLGVGR